MPMSDFFDAENEEMALEKRLPKVQTLFWNKHNAGIAANDEMLDEIFPQCDVAVAAYGH